MSPATAACKVFEAYGVRSWMRRCIRVGGRMRMLPRLRVGDVDAGTWTERVRRGGVWGGTL